MSEGSSSQPPVEKRELRGFPAAVATLASVSFIYFLLPVLAILIVGAYAVVVLGMKVSALQPWLQASVPAQFFFMLIAQIATIAVVFWLIKRFGWTKADIGLKKPRWFHPIIGLAAAVPYFILFLLLTQVVSHYVPGFKIDQEQQIGFDNVQGPMSLTLTFISLVILPPLAEEITMRGFLYTGVRKWLPRIVAAVVVSALFGAAHLAEGGAAGPLWIGALDTFALSLVLVWLREATGNLWAGITLHAFKNGIAFIALFILAVR